jgi:hypothetical protein
MMFAPGYTVFHCGYLKRKWEMISDTPKTDEAQFMPSEQPPAFNLAQYMVKAGFARTLERENAALRGWSKAQLDELHRISEALGTNDGHSSVTHIEILKEENAALRLDAERYRWLPIDSAPMDNKRPLLLASFNSDDGTLQGMDYDGSWESDRESWENPEVYWYWASAENNVEEPTHWMYQPDWYASIDAAMKEEGK